MNGSASTDGRSPTGEPSHDPEPGARAGGATDRGASATAWRRLGPALGLVFVAVPALFWRGEYVDVEALGFLRHYWGEQTIAQKVLDPRSVDYYRGRELSYAIDFVDAQWMRLLFERDVHFFLAPSAVLASLTLVVMGLRLAPRALPALSESTRWLGLLVLLSSFTFVSTIGIYYRSTKTVVAALLALLLLLVLAEERHPRLGPRAGFWAVFAAALAMSLLDRQGLFYVLLAALALGLRWARARRGAGLALGAWAAAPAWFVYNQWLGPWLIHATNGYWPSMEYQRLRPGVLLQSRLWSQSVDILGDWSSVLLGGLPPLLLGALAAAAAAAWLRRERRRGRPVLLPAVAGLMVAIAQVAVVALMVERHEPLTWVSNRLWYYPLTYQVFLVVVLLWCANRLAAEGEGGPRWVPIALAAVVAGNVAQWPELRERMHSIPAFAEQWRRSRFLVRSLEDGAAAPPLDAEYRRFYFECLDRFTHLAARAAAQVAEGAGLEATGVLEGRRVAWARRESQIVPRTTRPGPHVITGGVSLRPGDRLLILLGATTPRLLDEVGADPAREGPVFFHFVAELGAGPNDVRLVSQLPERRIRGESGRIRTGFALLLPVAVWPEPSALRDDPPAADPGRSP